MDFNPQEETLMSAVEARRILGSISESTLKRLVKNGKLKRSAACVGRMLFAPCEVRRLRDSTL